jgi:NADH-quinone oxidoreductase subunit E
LEKKLNIRAGETTADGKFTIYKTSCIGCCDNAPAMLMNGKAYTKLTHEKIDLILKGAE